MQLRAKDTDSAASRLFKRIRFGESTTARPLTHAHLMEESEKRLSIAMRSDAPVEALIAGRILDNPKDFRCWESEHANIMRRIAVERAAETQKGALLSAALALIHRKALFEFLRERQVRGDKRLRLITHFFGHRDYASSVVAEHGNYLRSAASYLCSSHLGAQVMFDSLFDEPLAQYEDLYNEYFLAYCNVLLVPELEGLTLNSHPLFMPLKQQVHRWRNALLQLTQSRSGIWRAPPDLN